MRAALLLFPLLLAAADVVDRVAVVIGKTVITESEIVDSMRVTEFFNDAPVDFSPEKRRAAAELLVDQQLLRNEMSASRFAMPSAGDADKVFREFVAQHYQGADTYSAALQKYGITEEQLKEQLTWQLALIRFTEFRFPADLAAPPEGAASQSGADRQATPAPESVDQQMENWLKDARKNTRVTFKSEAFQ